MRPTPANLEGLMNKTFTLDPMLVKRPNFAGVAECSQEVTLVESGDNAVELRVGHGDDSGLWVPYAETKAVVGYANRDTTWAASGPFSGCELSVGCKKDGANATLAVYVAHIARQSGSTAAQDWQAYYDANKLSAWYWNKIPIPSDTFFAASYVFTEFGMTGLTTMVRVDVKVTKMGGGDGTVFQIKRFK